MASHHRTDIIKQHSRFPIHRMTILMNSSRRFAI
jgi:hypothetical protein